MEPPGLVKLKSWRSTENRGVGTVPALGNLSSKTGYETGFLVLFLDLDRLLDWVLQDHI